METKENAWFWDAQIRQEGKWISIYGPFDNIEDAEDVIDACITKVKTSTAFRILPIENK